MSERRYLARRVAFAVLTIYLALSAVFLVVALTPDKNFKGERAMFAWSHAGEPDAPTEAEFQAFRDSYMEARGRSDASLPVRLGNYLWDVTTMEWGYSPTKRAWVAPLIGDALARTATYAVPGFLFAVVGGGLFGLFSANNRGERSEEAGRGLVYLLFGFPTFFLGVVGLTLVTGEGSAVGIVRDHVLPAAVLSLGLLAGFVSFVRAHSMEYVHADFVRAWRAKGLTEPAIWRRLLRTVSVPVTSLLVTELLAILLLNVYVVEFVFDIEGFGRLTYHAVQSHDISLILATTYVVILVGVVGSLLQDLLSAALDPRVDL